MREKVYEEDSLAKIRFRGVECCQLKIRVGYGLASRIGRRSV